MSEAPVNAPQDAGGTVGVPAAFDLGWNLSELRFARMPASGELLDKSAASEWTGGLPELSDLPPFDRVQLIAELVKQELSKLPQISALSLACDFTASPLHSDTVQTAVFDLHLGIFRGLAKAPRLQLAYRLGVALGHTVLAVRQPATSTLGKELSWGRVQTMTEWLNQLKRSLPTRSAEVVALTLKQWRDWVHEKPANFTDPRANQALRRQGQIWRGLLSGEQVASEMLTLASYAKAGTKMARQLGVVFVRFTVSPAGLAVAAVFTALILGAIWLLETRVDVGKLVILAVGLGGPIGVTATSAQATLKRTIAELQGPLWGAVLTEAIGEVAYVEPKKTEIVEKNEEPSSTPVNDTAPTDQPEVSAPSRTSPGTSGEPPHDKAPAGVSEGDENLS